MGVACHVTSGIKKGASFLLIMTVLSSAAWAKSKTEKDADDPSMTEDYRKGYDAGHAAAKGKGVWFLSGFFLPGIGMILPWVVSPTVPMDDLAGKSEDYVNGYTTAYAKRAKLKNFGWASVGTGTAVAVVVVVGVIVLATAAEDMSISCTNNIGSACGSALGNSVSCSSLPIISSLRNVYTGE